MDAKIRRVQVCGSCGGSITIYDIECSYCHNGLEPIGDVRHILPSVKDNPHATKDAVAIMSHLKSLEEFCHFFPDQIDYLTEAVRPLKEHKYLYREYIIDLLSLIAHYRSVCLDKSKDTRETHLEIYKRLDAIYNSLIGNPA